MVYLLKIVIFHSYVSLPEGIITEKYHGFLHMFPQIN